MSNETIPLAEDCKQDEIPRPRALRKVNLASEMDVARPGICRLAANEAPQG
jgi:hypothetical protein